jgi:hypothetical protein
MPWWHMWRLLFLSSISAALLACSGDDCGDPAAFEFGLTVSNSDVSLAYGDLLAGANNDCRENDAPAGVISLTIAGSQMGVSAPFTMCVGRPDLLETMPLTLGSAHVHLVDVSGTDMASGCTFTLDATQIPSGTVQAEHMCGNGVDAHGFGLVFDGHLGLRRTCGVTIDSIAVGITGHVAVKAM